MMCWLRRCKESNACAFDVIVADSLIIVATHWDRYSEIDHKDVDEQRRSTIDWNKDEAKRSVIQIFCLMFWMLIWCVKLDVRLLCMTSIPLFIKRCLNAWKDEYCKNHLMCRLMLKQRDRLLIVFVADSLKQIDIKRRNRLLIEMSINWLISTKQKIDCWIVSLTWRCSNLYVIRTYTIHEYDDSWPLNKRTFVSWRCCMLLHSRVRRLVIFQQENFDWSHNEEF